MPSSRLDKQRSDKQRSDKQLCADRTASWTPEAVRQQTPWLPNWSEPNAAVQAAYLDHYGLNYSKTLPVEHRTALVSVNTKASEYCIHLHWFKQRNPANAGNGLKVDNDAHVAHCQNSQNSQNDAVLFLHGLFDHAGCFQQAFYQFLQRGYHLLVPDLPGHGLSTGAGASIHHFDEYQQLLGALMPLLPELSPGPWIGAGQSTGGGIWLNHLLQHPTNELLPQSFLLFAPLIRPKNALWVKALYQCLRPFVSQIKRTFDPNTHNPEFQHFLEHQDPLQHRTISAAWVGAMLQWNRLMEQADPQRNPNRLYESLHVFQGTGDQTLDWRFNLTWMQRLFPKAQLVKIAEAGHHGLNEKALLQRRLWQAVDAVLHHSS